MLASQQFQYLLEVRDERAPRRIVCALAAGRRHVPLLWRPHPLLPQRKLPLQPPLLVPQGGQLAPPLAGAAMRAVVAAAVPCEAAMGTVVSVCGVISVAVLARRSVRSLRQSPKELVATDTKAWFYT